MLVSGNLHKTLSIDYLLVVRVAMVISPLLSLNHSLKIKVCLCKTFFIPYLTLKVHCACNISKF